MANPLIEKLKEMGIEFYERVTFEQLCSRLNKAIDDNGISTQVLKDQTHRGLFRSQKHIFELDIAGQDYTITVDFDPQNERVIIYYNANGMIGRSPIVIFYENGEIGFNWESNRIYFTNRDNHSVQAKLHRSRAVFESYVYELLEHLTTDKQLVQNIKDNKKDYSLFLAEISEKYTECNKQSA